MNHRQNCILCGTALGLVIVSSPVVEPLFEKYCHDCKIVKVSHIIERSESNIPTMLTGVPSQGASSDYVVGVIEDGENPSKT